MRRYVINSEEDLIKQIESDIELESELKQQDIVKGHVIEIRKSKSRRRRQ